MSGQPGTPRWKLIRFCRNGSCRRITWAAGHGGGESKCSAGPDNNYGRFVGKTAMQIFASGEAKIYIAVFAQFLKKQGAAWQVLV
jgi:hypothetical protein